MKNSLANKCKIFSIGLVVIACILCIINSGTTGTVYIVAGCAFSMILFAIGEIIELLEDIKYQSDARNETLLKILKNNEQNAIQKISENCEDFLNIKLESNTINNKESAAINTDSAHFPTRNIKAEIVCPSCGKKQRGNRDLCFNCAIKFIFDDENV